MPFTSSTRSKQPANGNGRSTETHARKVDEIFTRLKVHPSLRELRPGEALFRSGQRTVGAYQVLAGRVRLVRTDRKGRETVLYTAAEGDLIAEASLFSAKYHCDAIASTGAKVRLFPKQAVLSLFQTDPDAGCEFMGRLARQLMQLRTKLQMRNINSARERVRQYLAVNAGADGATVSLAGTLKELAADIGLTHEALYRVLAEMAADGEIRRSEGRIVRILSYDPDHSE
jgi:CRP/FNR family transcriptional regulator, dissimilatory nitrate respiration regulator